MSSLWADDVVHGGAGEVVDVEESAVEAMRTGLQCSHLAADTVFSQTKALSGALSQQQQCSWKYTAKHEITSVKVYLLKLRLIWHTWAAVLGANCRLQN